LILNNFSLQKLKFEIKISIYLKDCLHTVKIDSPGSFLFGLHQMNRLKNYIAFHNRNSASVLLISARGYLSMPNRIL